MSAPAAQRRLVRPPQTGAWRVFVTKLMVLTLALGFIFSSGPGPADADGIASAHASAEQVIGNTTPADHTDYGWVMHNAHCVGHGAVYPAPMAMEPVRAVYDVGYPTRRAVASPSNLNPPEKPPRA